MAENNNNSSSSNNGNSKPLSGLLVLLTALATFVALVGNYIRPLEQHVNQLETRIESVYERAVESDHLEEITSLRERLKAVDKDIELVKQVEELHCTRAKARLSKLETRDESSDILIRGILIDIERLRSISGNNNEVNKLYRDYYELLLKREESGGG